MPIEQKPVRLPIKSSTGDTLAPPQESIRCITDHRLLARVSRDGLHLYCRQSNEEQIISWDSLDEMRMRLQN